MISLGRAIITLLFTLIFGGLYVFPPGASGPSFTTNPEDDLDDGITMTPAPAHDADTNNEITIAPAPARPTLDTPRPKRRLPDIPLFTRKRNKYKVWALNARQKLLYDGDSIGSATDQYAYLFARMSMEAQNSVAVYFERGLTLEFTPFDFLAHLDTLYIDPNAADCAMSKIQTLCQALNESFSAFLPRFERLLYEA